MELRPLYFRLARYQFEVARSLLVLFIASLAAVMAALNCCCAAALAASIAICWFIRSIESLILVSGGRSKAALNVDSVDWKSLAHPTSSPMLRSSGRMRIEPFMLDSTPAPLSAFKGSGGVCRSRMRLVFQYTENCNQLTC